MPANDSRSKREAMTWFLDHRVHQTSVINSDYHGQVRYHRHLCQAPALIDQRQDDWNDDLENILKL